MQEAVGPLLAEMAGEQSVGGITFGAVAVVGDLQLLYLSGWERGGGCLRALRQGPVATEKGTKGLREGAGGFFSSTAAKQQPRGKY